MSRQGHFGSRQKRGFQSSGPSRGGRGGNYAGTGSINGPANSMYNINRPPVPGYFQQPPPLLPQPPPPPPQFNAQPAGASATAPYQITLNINPAMFSGNAPQIAPHPSQSGPPMDQYGPPPPPPYTPYEQPPPPPGNLSMNSGRQSTQSSDKAGIFEGQRSESGQEFSGTGNRSRMKGSFSKSLGNLNKKSNDMASPNARERGFSPGARGEYFHPCGGENTKHQSKSNQGHRQEDEGDFDDNRSVNSSPERNYNKGRPFHRGARWGGYNYNTGEHKARGGRGKYGGSYNRGGQRRSATENDIQERGRQESSCEYDEANNSDAASSEASYYRGKSHNQRRTGRWTRGSFRGHNRGEPKNSAFGNSDNGSCVHDKKERIRQESEQQGGARPKTSKAKPMRTSTQMVEELHFSLHFNTCFEKATALKGHIQSAHEISNSTDFKLSCEEIHLKHKENKSVCQLIISGSNMTMAQKYLHTMVPNLKQKLDTQVRFELEKPKREIARDVNYEPEGENVGSSKESCQKKRASKGKKRSKEEQDTIKSMNTCLSVITTVSLKIGKHFSSPAGFKTFLINATTPLEIDLQIDDSSISLSKEFSACEIRTKSKADARRLKKLFDELQKETRLDVEIRTCSAETKLEKAKSAMMMKKSELIQKHKEKISQIEEDVRKLESIKLGRDSETNIHAINCKLSEARKQEKEFLSCYDILYREMGNLPSSANTNDINPLQTFFDIECNRFNMACPVYAYRTEIIQQIKSSQVSIFVGENGCDKSTQIVQYLYDAGIGNANDSVIVCTQPEQLATVALAEKVAKEQSVKVGSLVGYRTGRNSKVDGNTKILFATDHWLLNECFVDPAFKKYSCIIVDEAHQRSVHTDLLLGMIKLFLPSRQDFKVIIISSPSEADVFEKYFGTGQTLAVGSGNFSVNVFHSHASSKDFTDYEEKAVSKALTIHANEDEGNILAFVSLPTETHRCCQEFESRYNGEKSFKCMPLHSQLCSDELRKIFKNLPDGQRKIIFATKFAETSFAFDGVKYIIDTGVTSDIKYDAEEKINVTKACRISQTSANFRKNCAGHAIGGNCCRLYSQEGFNALEKKNVPEIVRVHLEKALLKLLELGVNLKTYDFVQPPSDLALKVAMETLQRYKAIAVGQITETGKWISKFRFDLRLGFFISKAHQNNLLYDAIVLSAIVTFGDDMSYRNFSETESEVKTRNKENFGVEVVDSFVWLQIYKKWSETPKNQRSHWCQSLSVNYKLMNSVRICVEEVLSNLLKDFNVECNSEFSSRVESLITLKELYMRCRHPPSL